MGTEIAEWKVCNPCYDTIKCLVKPVTAQKITCMSTWTVILGELVEQFRVWCLLASCQFKQDVQQEQDILKLQLADLHTEIKGKTGLPKSQPQSSLS